MSTSKFLAIDYGASSGRAIVGILKDNKIRLEEVHRFPNKNVNVHGSLYWDIINLYEELVTGIKNAIAKGHTNIESIAVDTWGVDFGLITKDNQVLGYPFAYRDSRTDGILEKAFKLIPKNELYNLTGIQFMQINSVFQLLCMVQSKNTLIKSADKLLFMPDLLNFLLTGEKKSEYTISSTSQLLNAKTKKWESKIFEKLKLPQRLMADIVMPGQKIGELHQSIVQSTGMNKVDVIAVGSHDTASAVAAVPNLNKNCAYISSGTWSLIGIETDEPIINKKTFEYNFTNEGGVLGKIRFLRNVMGMWIIQRLKKEWENEGKEFTYVQLNSLAKKASPFKCVIDVDSPDFLNPENMLNAINEFCLRTNQKLPQTKGEYIRSVLESLALKYGMLIERINSLSKNKIEKINIVGGGSQNELLNQFTADATGLKVYAGPVEATAFGNILLQAIAKGKIKDLLSGREIVKNSVKIKEYSPKNKDKWESSIKIANKIMN
ncbi:MAG: rhamnulokinase [Ignavibacteriales bacterium]|nr:rhamnulokinase [Ignavibacteriales bacterium]